MLKVVIFRIKYSYAQTGVNWNFKGTRGEVKETYKRKAILLINNYMAFFFQKQAYKFKLVIQPFNIYSGKNAENIGKLK